MDPRGRVPPSSTYNILLLLLHHRMLQVAKMTQKFLAEATLSHEELFTTQIVNTEDSRSRGYHWFTIAISITRRRA